jgi:hypothetical protein
MKKLTIIILAMCMLFLGVQANAAVIDDSTLGANTYWGAANSMTGMPTNQDVYGGGPFAIDKMVVNFGGGIMTVQVIGSYFTAWTAGQTKSMAPGDLFIDLQGWNPVGTAPHFGDDNVVSHGQPWDLAFDLRTSALYSTVGGAIALTNNGMPPVGSPYRTGQEWDFLPAGNPLVGGAWNIAGDTLTMTFGYMGTGIDTATDLGMHWTMQCGNDVVNGGVPRVPEPSMLLLFGSGLLGLAFFARKKA